ncbi:MAG: hypothetical protein HKN23_07735 [Verrucomicrobiales bacterium]|nr:hypothetical protein [Verrucomicrobiales bacterium]
MRFFKRHILSLTALLLFAWSIWGWFHSSREWTSYNGETSIGIFRAACESSMFMVAVAEMNHEHRWKFWRESDAITGDRMRFVWAAPAFQAAHGQVSLLLPFWQVALFLTLIALITWKLERRRIRKARR